MTYAIVPTDVLGAHVRMLGSIMRKIMAGLAGAVMVAMVAACGGGSSNQGVTDALGSGGSSNSNSNSACSTCAAPSSTGTSIAGNTNTNASAISTVAVQIPQNNLLPSTLQTPQANGVYTMDVASGVVTTNGGLSSVVNTSPQTGVTANTVTLETDANGNLFSVQFNITNNTATVNNTHPAEFVAGPYTPLFNSGTGIYDAVGGNGNSGAPFRAWGGSPSAPDPGSFFTVAFNALSQVNNSGGSNFVFSMLTGANTTLTAGAYGMWMNNPGAGTGGIGVFALGNTALVPGALHGTAIYNGQTIGAVSYTTTGNAANLLLLAGTIALNVNFDTATVNTTISNITTKDMATSATTTNPLPASITGTQTISSSSYQGSLAGSTGNFTGTLKGGFLAGSGGAVETVGTWNLSGTTTVGGNTSTISAIGAYGAK